MNVHVPGQDITVGDFRIVCRSCSNTPVQEGYTWFSSIVAALAAFAVVGAYTTYKFMRR